MNSFSASSIPHLSLHPSSLPLFLISSSIPHTFPPLSLAPSSCCPIPPLSLSYTIFLLPYTSSESPLPPLSDIIPPPLLFNLSLTLQSKVKQELLQYSIQLEEFGGETQAIEVSALTGKGIEALEEAIIAQAEMSNIEGDYTGPVEGFIVESRTDKGLGYEDVWF